MIKLLRRYKGQIVILTREDDDEKKSRRHSIETVVIFPNHPTDEADEDSDELRALERDWMSSSVVSEVESPVLEALLKTDKLLGEKIAKIAGDFFAAGFKAGSEETQRQIEQRLLGLLRG